MSKGSGGATLVGGRSVGRPGGYAREADLTGDFEDKSFWGEPDAFGDFPKASLKKESGKNLLEWLHQQYPDYEQTLTKHQATVIRDYTGTGFGSLNTDLRTNAGLIPPAHETMVKDLDAAMRPTTQNLTLWRGMMMPKDPHEARSQIGVAAIGEIKPGAVLTDHGYLSTSLEKGISHTFLDPTPAVQNYVLSIRVPKGTPAIPADAMFARPGEWEMILPRGSRLRVRSVADVPEPPFQPAAGTWTGPPPKPMNIKLVVADYLPPERKS